MIVKCASCQTRFKIGDEKVTARGVKVRCTKCGTVFRVSKDPPGEAVLSSAATPLEDLVAPASAAAPAPASDALEDIFQSMVPDPTGAGQDRPPEPPMASAELELDLPPTAGPASDSAGDAHDPFSLLGASFVAEPPPVVRQRGNGKSPLETLASLDDPFDLPLDPLGKTKTPMPSSPHVPLEDDPFAAFAAGAAAAAQAEARGSSSGLSTAEPGDFADPLAGLDLDPGRASIPAPPPPDETDFPADAAPWGESLDLDTRASSPEARGPVRQPTPANAPLAALGGETTKVVGGFRPPSHAGQELGGDARASRGDAGAAARAKSETPLATRVVNAIASISVVLLVLLIFVIWRNGGRVDLRDPGSAFLSAFGVHRSVPVSQSLPALISSSGLYRSESGLPVLFVRGRVQNLTSRSQRLRVRLTVEDSGRVAAESEAWPATVPTPDELYAVRSSADLKRLQRGWDEREPPPLDAQGMADFMVVTADLPTNLGSVLLKVVAVPQGEGAGHAAEQSGAKPPSAPREAANLSAGSRPPNSDPPPGALKGTTPTPPGDPSAP